MRAWATAIAILVLIGPSMAPASGHHGTLTAGIIHSGPETWTVTDPTPIVHRLQGQVHADGPRDIVIGLPDGFRSCDTCRADWIGVTLDGLSTDATYEEVRDQDGIALRLVGTTWDFTTTLFVDFTVTIAIDNTTSIGTYPFYLGIKSLPTSCGSICLGVGAAVHVEATVPERPVVTFLAPNPNAYIGPDGTAHGTASAATLFTVDARIDDGTYFLVDGSETWSLSFDPKLLNEGTHTLTVRATDSDGIIGTATTRFQIDHTAPAVGILEPGPRHGHSLGHGIQHDVADKTFVVGPNPIRAAAQDGGSGVASVTLCVLDAGDRSILDCTTDTTDPYENPYWEENSDHGERIVTAQAHDSVGNASPVVEVRVLKA